MRKRIKYLISVGFLLYGVLQAVIHGTMLWDILMTLLTAGDVIIKSSDLLFYYVSCGFEIMQAVFMMICAVMYICISLRKKNWKYILRSGLLELSARVLTCIYALYMQMTLHAQTFNVQFLLNVLKFAIIPLCIIGFALYSRKHESSYEPLPILPARWRGKTE